MTNKDKWKFTRVALWDLKEINKLINEKILAPYDEEFPDFIYWWVKWKSHIKSVKVHWKKYIRSSINLDLKKYFEHITYEMVINWLQKIWIANKIWAKIIANVSCVDIWEIPKHWWNRVIARWFNTSTRLAVISSLQFFKNLNTLVMKTFKWLDPKITIFVDDVCISFDNTNEEKIKFFIEKATELAQRFNMPFNRIKTEENINKPVETLWLIQDRQKTKLPRKFEKKLKEERKEFYLGDKTNKTLYNKIKWKMNYKKQVKKWNKEYLQKKKKNSIIKQIN